jgi:hypothetical protein
MKKLKLYVPFLIVFSSVLFSFLSLSRIASKPEKLLIGKWKEVEWMYEKSDKNQASNKIELSDEIKNIISKDLVIHCSETWEFKNEAVLLLTKKGEKKHAIKWKLKGRGHILKLRHSNEIKEYYQIKELTEDRLVIHFENDIHTRGIVRIEFKKIK